MPPPADLQLRRRLNAAIALIKRTYFGENRNIEFRAEAFNVTNTPPLGAPATVAGAHRAFFSLA